MTARNNKPRPYSNAKGFKEYNRVQIAVRLDPDDFEAVREACERNNVSIACGLRKIVRQWKREHYKKQADRRNP